MKHLDDGTLQAFLDDELRPRERADAAEHLMGCRACQQAKEELVRARSVFSEAVSLLDVDAPGASAPASGRLRMGGSAFVKAAGLTLLLAAAASAAVPGSPVREWIVRAVQPEPEETPVLEAVEPAPAPAPAPASAPAGVSLPASSAVEVVIDELDGTVVRLVETGTERVSVSALGADTDPTFSMATGRIEVRGAVGGEITVELPRSAGPVRLVVGGRLYAEGIGGDLTVHVEPAETGDGALVWR